MSALIARLDLFLLSGEFNLTLDSVPIGEGKKLFFLRLSLFLFLPFLLFFVRNLEVRSIMHPLRPLPLCHLTHFISPCSTCRQPPPTRVRPTRRHDEHDLHALSPIFFFLHDGFLAPLLPLL